MDHPHASVIICTYNRAHLIGQVLDDLLAQDTSEELRWEIVVVDNNSSDRTREIVEAYARQHPQLIRYVFEGRQGKSFALNTGIEATTGEYLLFTDDDVRVEPVWVQSLVEFFRAHPAAMGIGGRVIPILSTKVRPSLDPDEIQRYFSFDFGEEVRPLDQAPRGDNSAYPRKAFEEHGVFRTDLGPTQDNRGGLSEDSEFATRILDARQEFWYLPAAAVHHAGHAEELTPDYLDRWHYQYGRALIRRTGLPRPIRKVFSVPRFLFRSLAEAWLVWVCSPTPRARRHRHWQLQKVRGQIHEARRIIQESESTGVVADESPGHRS